MLSVKKDRDTRVSVPLSYEMYPEKYASQYAEFVLAPVPEEDYFLIAQETLCTSEDDEEVPSLHVTTEDLFRLPPTSLHRGRNNCMAFCVWSDGGHATVTRHTSHHRKSAA